MNREIDQDTVLDHFWYEGRPHHDARQDESVTDWFLYCLFALDIIDGPWDYVRD